MEEKNRFLAHEGREGGEFLVYRHCEEFNEEHAAKRLQDRGYLNFRAAGSIDSSRRIIRFEQPTDASLCIQLLRRIITDDLENLDHYRSYEVFGPNGQSFGRLESHWIPE